MPWYVIIALRHLFPEGRWFSLFTFISVIGTTLGVALLHIVIAVFNGFGYEIRGRIAESFGDLRVENRSILYDYEEYSEKLLADDRVKAVAPYAHGMVMAQRGNLPVFPAIQGIDLVQEEEVVPIAKYLQVGALDDLDDDSIFLSSGIASRLGAYVGVEIELYTPLLLEKLKQDEILLPRQVRVAGIFHTGWNDLDENTVLCTLRLMQDLYGLEEGVHGLKVRLHEGEDEMAAAEDFNELFERRVNVFTWMDSNNAFLSVLQFEKRMMFFLLSFIVLVASFSIISPLLIAVVRKTREIGLFASMGATSSQIAACFCLQAVFLGLVGVLSGFGLGAIALRFRDQIITFFATVTGAGDSIHDVYPFSFLPSHVQVSDMLVIGLLALIVSFLAGIIPALKAGKMKPVDALRSE
ncbi:ABC transporter permease [Puniceicoccaceae bacterium K14]|nr:ABC transporter permease [Puniceicoccaceae bacterium K14]